MEIIIGLVVLFCVGYFIFGRKVGAWNADPRQQQIAQMLIESAETESSRKEIEIIKFMLNQGWGKTEMKRRIAHAVSITKVASVPSIYQGAKEAGLRITHTVATTP
jgi:hypothetical protein